MIFRRFTVLSILRILLIMVNVFILASILGDDRLFFNQIILGTILVFQIWELIRFVNVTNRELTKFIEAIRQTDFTINFTKDTLGKSFSGLFESMRSLLDAYKKVKIEKEAQYHLLQQIIAHVPAGIMVVADKETIVMLNDSAKKILEIPDMRTWKGLKAKAPYFTNILSDLPDSGRYLMEMVVADSKKTLSMDLSHFTLLEQEYDLITFSDIKSEIEQKEIEAWHRLIRILTHEIMNSVTPISSLTETMQLMLTDRTSNKLKSVSAIENETIKDLSFSLKTIQKRSDGLLNFVEDYRRLTRVPKPELVPTYADEILKNVLQLMSSELGALQIENHAEVEEGHQIYLDRNLIEQVLINLVKNSIEAVGEMSNARIILKSYSEGTKDFIEVCDNGLGVDPGLVEDIWVPFFTTKPEGSGIGLSLSKQIMKLHRGNITIESQIGNQTIFRLEFPKKTA